MADTEFLTFADSAGANVVTQADYSSSDYQQNGFLAGIAKSAQVNKALRQPNVISNMITQWMANTLSADVLDNGDAAGLLAQFEAALTAYISGSITGGTRPPTVLNANFSVSSAQNEAILYVTGARTGTLAQASGLSNGLWFNIQAADSIVTLTPNATDKINGGTTGASYQLPAGTNALVVTDGATNWYVLSDILALTGALPQYAADSGAANAYVATYSPAVTSYTTGKPVLYFKAANANTGASTFNPGPGVKSLLRPDGNALRSGDIVAGAIIGVVYDGTAYRAISGLSNGFSESLGNTGYVVHPDGFIIQWGRYSSTISAEGSISVTFPLAFTTGCYVALGSILNASAGAGNPQDVWTQTISRSTTQAVFMIQSSATVSPSVNGFDWIAFGK